MKMKETRKERPVAAAADETDDDLRRIYGDKALVSRVGRFTLIHLDAPTPERLARREADFDPREYFFDDCPLCCMARDQGGHIVFDGDVPEPGAKAAREGEKAREGDVQRADDRADPAGTEADGAADSSRYETGPLGPTEAEVELSPSAAFNVALVDMLGASEVFGEQIPEDAPPERAERYFEDVESLYERLMESIWFDETRGRVEQFDHLVARAVAAVDAVCAAMPGLTEEAEPLREGIDAVAKAWRDL